MEKKLSETEIRDRLPEIIMAHHQPGEDSVPFKEWDQEKKDRYYQDYGFVGLVLGEVFKTTEQ